MKNEEYRIKITGKNNESTTPTTNDPKAAGNEYRNIKKNLPNNTIVELQKREINPWTTVESSGSIPPES